MNKMSRAVLLFVFILSAAARISAQETKSPPLTRVKVAMRGTSEVVFLLIAKEKKYFAQEGIEIEELAIGGGSSAVLNALVSGAVDVGKGSYVFAMNDTIKKSGIKMVADNTHIAKGKPGHAYSLVRRGLADKVKTYSDLKGLRVAMPTQGSLAHVRFLRELDKAGLTEKDIDARYYPATMRPLLFASKEFDVGYFIDPQGSILAAAGMGRVFAGSNMLDEDMPGSMLFYSSKFLKNGDAPQRFMNAYLRAVRYFNLMGPEEAAVFAQKIWGDDVPDEVFGSLHCYNDGHVDVAHVLAAQDYAVSKGIATVKLEAKDLFDFSFAREASAKV